MTKRVTLVIISTMVFQDSSRSRPQLPHHSYNKGHFFWVAGQSEDGMYFVAKSQDKLVENEAAEWKNPLWSLVQKENCQVAMLENTEAAWVLCPASPLSS